MAKFNVGLSKTRRMVHVEEDGKPLAEGFTNIGVIDHPSIHDTLGDAVSHVLWHHVRDLLYKQGITDMRDYPILRKIEPG